MNNSSARKDNLRRERQAEGIAAAKELWSKVVYG